MTRLTLTFDNGPTPGVTERVLDELGARGLPATFFVVGDHLQRPGARELAERAHAEGHWIGNHTMHHGVPLGERDAAAPALAEIDDAESALGRLARPERLFRPNGRGLVGPHLLSRAALDHLVAGRFTVVLWTIFVGDTEAPDGWVDRALAAIAAGGGLEDGAGRGGLEDRAGGDWHVLVAHDVASGAMDDLPRLLDAVVAGGADIVQEFPAGCLPLQRGRPGPGLERIAPAAPPADLR